MRRELAGVFNHFHLARAGVGSGRFCGAPTAKMPSEPADFSAIIFSVSGALPVTIFAPHFLCSDPGESIGD